ncbi:hypothetical protein [Sphingomonas sp. IW22]|uniref:hypothetical protein n=1 Tax=Sphingomonas sp. IW22 TaxID=3242489 RepID=UPI003521DCA7
MVPNKSTIQRLVNKFRLTGSVLDAPRSGRPNIQSESLIQKMASSVIVNRSISVRRLSSETEVCPETCRKVLKKKLKMRPYKKSSLYEIKESDYRKRVTFCEWIILKHTENPKLLDNLYFSDEAWFHLSGYVNAQNSRHWARNNPYEFVQHPLHSTKIGVWCAISKLKLIGPIFFHETINSVRYLKIFNDFISKLTEEEISSGYYQQDNARPHVSNLSLSRIHEIFEDRLISKNLWPPRSPDLTPPDYFLWAHLKRVAYRKNPKTLDNLKEAITREINNINAETLERVSNNFLRRVDLCLKCDGNHFSYLL